MQKCQALSICTDQGMNRISSRRSRLGYTLLALTVLSLTMLFGQGTAVAADTANTQPVALKPEDVFALQLANDPQISPDGEHIAYVRTHADMMQDTYVPVIWTVNADGSQDTPLSSEGEKAAFPRWSPDGSKLAYTALREGGRQIVVRWMENGAETTIGGLVTDPSNLVWSPDGKWLAFAMFVPKEPAGYSKEITPPPGATWKPGPVTVDTAFYRLDSVGMIPRGAMHVFVVPAEGGEVRQITKGADGYFPFAGTAFDWMADSASLIVSLNLHGEYDMLQGKWLDTALYQFPVDGSKMKKIADPVDIETSPKVSPDGKYIAYIGREQTEQQYRLTRLMLWELKTGKHRVISQKLDRDVVSAQWAADSKSLYAYYADHGKNKLAKFDLGGRVTDVAEGLGMVHTAYLAEPSFSVAQKGRIAMQWSSPASSGNIAVVEPDGHNFRLVTTLNKELFDHRTLGKVEEINYRSRKDDLPVQGWIMYPPGFNKSQKYPLVLEIHGGPNTAYGPRFDIEKQIIAAAGYVVFYPNVRGSSSYGTEYGNMIQNNFPGDEFDDLMSGVDAVVARGFIDPARLYITGGSGGGTLTAWTISRTDRFRAAVAMYPVINWESQALTSDIMSEVFQGFFFGTPWNQPEEYQRRSLLRTVGNVKTPVMIMTGEADYRTPISESEQYFAALQYHGVESVFVRVPMENHGIRRYPSHFAHKMANTINWFKSHQ